MQGKLLPPDREICMYGRAGIPLESAKCCRRVFPLEDYYYLCINNTKWYFMP